MVGITSLNAHIFSRSFRKKFDITPVAGTRKARLRCLAFLFSAGTGGGLQWTVLQAFENQLLIK